MSDAAPAGEHLLRELAPRVLATVVRRFGDFAASEDAVQEALLAAATQWPGAGVPDNPAGWLVHVATRRMQDHVRSELARRRREARVVALTPPDEHIVAAPDGDPGPAHDDTLLLLFMCCHPSLTRPSAIALTLRAVGGLTTAEIANAFFVPESTMAQRISRAKRQIARSGVPFAMPPDPARSEQLSAALHVLYLIFNEGYASSGGPRLQRADLTREAIRLTREVHRALPDQAEVGGLLALMLLTDARRAARTTAEGAIVPLDEQDRSRWCRASIDEGVAILTAALARGAVGPYQLQAAIAAVHDQAQRYEDTDWAEIRALYGLLGRITDNPMVALNHAVAVAMAEGAEAGLARLEALDADPRLGDHHRLHAVRAHLFERLGKRGEAIAGYRAAARRTASAPERDYLLRKAAKLEAE